MTWKNRPVLKRKLNYRKLKETFLIVCEGKKTEEKYFKSFCVATADVKIIGTGMNTKTLVEFAKNESEKAKNKKESYNQIWCVFDKDSFLKDDFNNAVKMAKDNGFKTAYSNECFELWFILHFEYLISNIGREKYYKKLTNLLNKKYEKSDSVMYDKLLDKQETAIKNAKKLLKQYKDLSKPADNVPSTTVHQLVEELNKYKKN